MSSPGRLRSRDDEAGLFALEFLGARELAAKEFDELARAGTSIGAQESHAKEKDEQLEDFGVLRRTYGSGGGLLLDFGEEGREGVVKFALYREDGRLFVDNAGGERFAGFGKRAESGENVGICGRGLRGGKFGDAEGDGGQKLGVQVNDVGGNADTEERSVGGQRPGVLLFVAMGGEEVSAVGGAVDREFAFRAAADGTDFFGLSGAEAARLAFVADWTKHNVPLGETNFAGALRVPGLRNPCLSELHLSELKPDAVTA
jgi:hypothetical protein